MSKPNFAITKAYKAWWDSNYPKLMNFSIYSKCAATWNAALASQAEAALPLAEPFCWALAHNGKFRGEACCTKWGSDLDLEKLEDEGMASGVEVIPLYTAPVPAATNAPAQLLSLSADETAAVLAWLEIHRSDTTSVVPHIERDAALTDEEITSIILCLFGTQPQREFEDCLRLGKAVVAAISAQEKPNG